MTPEEKKTKEREYSKRYRDSHREQRRIAGQLYYRANRAKLEAWIKANPEKVSEYKKRHVEANRERIREARKAQYQANREAVIERTRQWRLAHPEEAKALHRKNLRDWRAAHPEQDLANDANRRARVAGNGGHHTASDISDLYEKQEHRCAAPWCKAKIAKSGPHRFHLDHIVPIKLGGSSDPHNLQLLCKACNLKKNAKHPDDWAKDHGRLFL